MRIGIDIGSTTIKAVVVNEERQILFSDYQRHYSQIGDKALELLHTIQQNFPNEENPYIAISGSAGMGLAQACAVPFIQEVHATKVAVEALNPGTDVVIELGGEDAKIIFLKGIVDARMNGSCAGGTGAFIDQMATLLHVTTEELNELAKDHEKVYTIASRCGVFAKSDVQPLLNQGARESDIAQSIFYAVVNQTIAGLAQGRPIAGNVMYLGGPLSFLSQLRYCFDKTLRLNGTCPENSLYYVAMGAAMSTKESQSISLLMERLIACMDEQSFAHMEPLFNNKEEYEAFTARHSRAKAQRASMEEYASKGVFLGIDAGSTTLKFALINEEGALVHSHYQSNSGNPIPLVRDFLLSLYEAYPNIRILNSAVTGYGEGLIQHAFHVDEGLVETMAHFIAARALVPSVDFIIDIGGQDMKCVKIHNNMIDNIYLNEACSSGCGSFLQTFANALGQEISDFAKLGLFANKPVDLGSRCTVFMNSSVKQAQKDGASTENISAGLSISVVKNALYKVIRPSSKEDLGNHIVVQGGTFYNDAVLRAFEQEMELTVTRPDIAGLMGAYGAALYGRGQYEKRKGTSTIINMEGLKAFSHQVKVANCGLCQNNCRLTINTFAGNRNYISGNRCERPVTQKIADASLNLYSKKLSMLKGLSSPAEDINRKTIGIPFVLNMYELLPFWHAFFLELNYNIVLSPVSDRKLYLKGQGTIPSDTICFPAKLAHGHIQALIDQGIQTIFYPCMSYNIDDGMGDNCYNCPIVAYYPEVIKANMPDIEKVNFIYGYVGLHRKRDVSKKLYELLAPSLDVTLAQVKSAVKKGYEAYENHMKAIAKEGKRIIEAARAQGKPIIVLAGRPYHVDPEINHGIDKLISGLNGAVISEDALFMYIQDGFPLQVLNQWTYHRRLYHAAKYVAAQPDMQFVQLVSFGCGCDAITTDECRRMIEESGKIYTQIKIDEIENLGAANIRLRSLFAVTGIERVEK